MGGSSGPSGWQALPRLVRLAIGCGCLLLLAGAVFVLALLASRLVSLVIALAAALLIAALLEPVMHLLLRLRLPRALSALLSVLLLLAVFVTPIVLLWSLAAGQYGDLAERVRDGVERLRTFGSRVLPVSDAQINQILDDIESRLQVGTNAVAGALTIAEVLAAVILALFVAFFLLKDGPSMWEWFVDQMPGRARASLEDVGAASWETLTRYIRGILIIAVIDAVGIGIALVLIGVPFALPLALLVLVGSFVPYVGSTISGSVAVLVALAANGPIDALLTLAAVVAVQQLEGNILEPFIVGRQVRLHPVAVVVAVFAGALIAGIAGAIIAVPLVAVGYRVVRVLRARRLVGSDADLHQGPVEQGV
ncbi:MAG TPA: AI-2E family transporter [Micromonosporaceae bacterium]|nr:AI-2E family transporter [Micromonosporaceae bacterium]